MTINIPEWLLWLVGGVMGIAALFIFVLGVILLRGMGTRFK